MNVPAILKWAVWCQASYYSPAMSSAYFLPTSRQLLVLAVAVALAFATSDTSANPITYHIEPIALASSNIPNEQLTITGTITTDGTFGALLPSDVISWNWSASGPGMTESYDHSSADPGSSLQFDGFGLIATAHTLEVPFVSNPFPQKCA